MTMSTSCDRQPSSASAASTVSSGVTVWGSMRDHLAASRMPVSTRILRPAPSMAAAQTGTSSTVPFGYW